MTKMLFSLSLPPSLILIIIVLDSLFASSVAAIPHFSRSRPQAPWTLCLYLNDSLFTYCLWRFFLLLLLWIQSVTVNRWISSGRPMIKQLCVFKTKTHAHTIYTQKPHFSVLCHITCIDFCYVVTWNLL